MERIERERKQESLQVICETSDWTEGAAAGEAGAGKRRRREGESRDMTVGGTSGRMRREVGSERSGRTGVLFAQRGCMTYGVCKGL